MSKEEMIEEIKKMTVVELSELVKAEGEFGKQIATICNCGRRNYTHISCTKVIGTTDDNFIIPTIDSAVGSNVTLQEPHISEREAKDIFLKLFKERIII